MKVKLHTVHKFEEKGGRHQGVPMGQLQSPAAAAIASPTGADCNHTTVSCAVFVHATSGSQLQAVLSVSGQGFVVMMLLSPEPGNMPEHTKTLRSIDAFTVARLGWDKVCPCGRDYSLLSPTA